MCTMIFEQVEVWKHAKEEYWRLGRSCLRYSQRLDEITAKIRGLSVIRDALKDPKHVAYFQDKIDWERHQFDLNVKLFEEDYQDFKTWEEVASMTLIQYLKDWIL